MTTTVDYQLADLDQQLADAHTRLRAARDACRHSPNGQTIAAVEAAIRERDDLLDQRLTLASPRTASP